MNFLSGLAKGGDSKTQPGGEEKSSTTDLFADAKVVAEAARAQFSNEPEKCDKAKAAGSAADLLDAASQYGKLDSTQGVGKYVDQAEGYLRQYGAPKSTPANHVTETETANHVTETPNHVTETANHVTETANHVTETEIPKPEAGDYAKKAEELLGEKSGAEGLLKAAGGFFGK
ncbi:nodulin-related protein 2-like [Salvia hispanica]|uniref:nodulin-related protein 2-like n=1 Tax=Salvia hispanica TaxID=49212 RepID=UPI002009987E|nr:nodulin-related protein 2-like [Salvia hispanica]